MAIRSDSQVSLGLPFTVALAVAWLLITLAVALAIAAEPDAGSLRVASWVSLWVFSVLMPTLNAFTLHRVLRELAGRTDERHLRQLARMRAMVLLTANMAVLSAVALIVRR